jgi:hypothetical protein
MYEFVGRLMAGAIQSDEHIVVPLPPYVWRKIAGAPCSQRDYCLSIDESLANYAKMTFFDRETFEVRLGTSHLPKPVVAGRRGRGGC